MPNQSDLNELPVSIDFYYLIGKIAVISSTLEKSVWWLLHYLQHYHFQPDLDGWEYEPKKTTSFDKKSKSIRSLTRRRGWSPQEQEFVEEWLSAVAAFREIRHDVVHSFWMNHGEDHSKYTLDARDWKFDDGPVALDSLRVKAAEGEHTLRIKCQVADLALAYLFSTVPALGTANPGDAASAS